MMRDSDPKLTALIEDLSRLRRRAARQKLNVQESDNWQRWSTTMDEIAGLTERLLSSPTADLAGIAEKFRAILWLIEINESLLDTGDMRRLRRFGRQLDGLVRHSLA